MSVPSISDILGSPVINDLRADLISRLQVPAFVLTDEFKGAVARTIWEIEAYVLLDLVGLDGDAQQTAANGSAGIDTDTDWLTKIAHCLYELDRTPGTFAVQTVVLACAAGLGPYAIVAERGQLSNAAGQTFTPQSGGTLSGGGTLTIQARAESAGAARGLINKLVSPMLAGVTVQSAVTFDPGTGPLYGSDTESDVALLARILARWPALDDIPTDDRMVKWAKASTTEITRVKLTVDGTNAGGVIITVAGVSGAVSGGAVTAAQAYIDVRAPITDFPTVQNATTLNVSATAGTVFVAASKLADAQVTADANWLLALGQTQIGGIVYLSKLEQILKDIDGVDDVLALALNGAATDVTLASTQVPVKSGNLSAQLTWVAI